MPIEDLFNKLKNNKILFAEDFENNESTVSPGDLGFKINEEEGVMLDKREAKSFSKRDIMVDPNNLEHSEELRAQKQRFDEKAVNGIIKFVGKTGTAVLGATIGSGAGIVEVLRGGSFFDNDFQRSMDSANEWMDDTFRNYYTEAERNDRWFESITRTNFWFNDLGGALSFTTGAILSELALSAATAATLGATAPIQFAQTASILTKAKQILKSIKAANKAKKTKTTIQKAGTLTRQLMTGAGYEAGVEARHYKDETLEAYKQKFIQEQGREPSDEELIPIVENINKRANFVFSANMALVGASNAAQFPKIFGFKSPNFLKKADDVTIKGSTLTGKAIARTKELNKAEKAWNYIKNPIYEGFAEEGGQGVISRSNKDFILSKYNTDGTENAVSMIDSVVEGIKESYGTDEGFKEVFMGMLVGGISGVFTKPWKQEQKNIDLQNAINEEKATTINEVSFDNIQKSIKNHASQYDLNNSENPFDHDDSTFVFLSQREDLGLLSNTQEEYNEYIDELSEDQFREDLGYTNLSKEEIAQEKQKLKLDFNEAIQNVKEVKKATKNLTDNELIDNVLARNLYQIKNSDKNIEKSLEEISRQIGTTNADLLSYYHKLQSSFGGNVAALNRFNRQLERISKIDEKINTADQSNTKRLESLIKQKEQIIEDTLGAMSQTKLKQQELSEKEQPVYDLNYNKLKDFLNKASDFVNIKLALSEALDKDPVEANKLLKAFETLKTNERNRIEALNNYNNLFTKQAQNDLLNTLGTEHYKLLSELNYNFNDNLMTQEFEKLKEQHLRMMNAATNGKYTNRLIKEAEKKENERREEEFQNNLKKKTTETEDPDTGEITKEVDPAIKGHSNITKIIFTNPEIETWVSNQDKLSVTKGIRIVKIDYVPERELADTNQSNLKIINGLTVDKGKGLKIMLDVSDMDVPESIPVINGEIELGYMLDPRRFLLDNEPLDLSDPKQLEKVNPDLVIQQGDNLILSSSGKKLAANYEILVKLFEEYVDNKDIISNDLNKALMISWNNYYTLKRKNELKTTIEKTFSVEENSIHPFSMVNNEKEYGEKGIYVASKDFSKVFIINEQGTKEVKKTAKLILWMKMQKDFLNGQSLLDIHEHNNKSQYSAIINHKGLPIIIDVGFPTENSENLKTIDLSESFKEALSIDSNELNIFSPLKNNGEQIGMLMDIPKSSSLKAIIRLNIAKRIKGDDIPGGMIAINFSIKDKKTQDSRKSTLYLEKIFYHNDKTYYFKGNLEKLIKKEDKNHDNELREKIFLEEINKFEKGEASNIKELEIKDLKETIVYKLNKNRRLNPEGFKFNEQIFNFVEEIDKNEGSPEKFIVNSVPKTSLTINPANYLIENYYKLKKEEKKQEKNENSSSSNFGKEELFNNTIEAIQSYYETETDKDLNRVKKLLYQIAQNELLEDFYTKVEEINFDISRIIDIINNGPKQKQTPVKDNESTSNKYTEEEYNALTSAFNILEELQGSLNDEQLNVLNSIVKKEDFDSFEDWYNNELNRKKKNEDDEDALGGYQFNSEDKELIEENIEDAKVELAKILDIKTDDNPNGSIEVNELDQFIDNVKSNNIPLGRVIDASILLGKKRTKGTKYHEAFHIVFRNILTKEEQQRVLKLAKKTWKHSQKDLEKLRIKLLSQGYDVSGQDLIDLFYEEKLADSFENYKLNNKSHSWLRKIWEKIKRWISKITNNERINDLYYDISIGKYKNKKATQVAFNVPANKLLEIKSYDVRTGKTEKQVISRKITNLIIGKISNHIFNNTPNSLEFTDENFKIAVNRLLNIYSIDEFSNLSLSFSKELKLHNDLLTIKKALTNPETLNDIKNEVKNKLKIFNIEETFNEKEEDEESKEDEISAENWMKDSIEIGGFGNLSKRMKSLISFSETYIDVFNLGIDVEDDQRFKTVVNASEVYSGISRALANKEREKFFRILKNYSKYNKQSNAFYFDLLMQISDESKMDLDTLENYLLSGRYDKIPHSSTLVDFINSFYTMKGEFMFVRFDPETNRSDSFNSNSKDVDKIQFDRWANKFSSLNLTKNDVTEILLNAQNQYESLSEDIEQIAISTKEELLKIGIDVSIPYLIYSIVYDRINNDIILGQNESFIVKNTIYDKSAINTGISPYSKTINGKVKTITEEEYNDALSKHRKSGGSVTFTPEHLRITDPELLSIYNDYKSTVVPFHLANEAQGTFKGLIKNNEQSNLSPSNPLGFFEKTKNEEGVEDNETGASNTLLYIARGNAIFDETVGDSVFRNSEDKMIYDKMQPSFLLEINNIFRTYSNDFANLESEEDLMEFLSTHGYSINEYEAKKLWQVYENNYFRLNPELLQNTLLFIHDGLKSAKLKDVDGNQVEDTFLGRQKGAAYKKLSPGESEIYSMVNWIKPGRFKTRNKKEYGLVQVGVNEGKSRTISILAPKEQYYLENTLSNLGKEIMFNALNQEFERIKNVQNEEVLDPAYNDGKNGRGYKLFLFKNFPHADKIEEFAKLKNTNLSDFSIESEDGKTKNINDLLNEYANKLFDNYLQKLEQLKLIKEDKAEFLPEEFIYEGNINKKELQNYFFNNYFNTLSYNQLIHGDFAMNYKDYTDVVKRNGGLIADGPSLSISNKSINYAIVESVQIPIELYDEFTKSNKTKSIDRTDAQSLGTVKFMRTFLKGQGRYNNKVSEILDEIEMGIGISNKKLRILEKNNATLQPKKIVTRSFFSYIKTSLHTVTREQVSEFTVSPKKVRQTWDYYKKILEEYSNDQTNQELNFELRQAKLDVLRLYKPRKGKELMHQFLNKTFMSDIDFITFDSSVKTFKSNVTKSQINPRQGNYDVLNDIWDNIVLQKIDSNTIREQVITDGFKTKIIHGTQPMQLVFSEQDREGTKDTYVEIYGKKIKVKDASKAYQKFLSDRINMATELLYDAIFKVDSKGEVTEANFKYIIESLKDSLNASNSEQYILELFTTTLEDLPKYNLNFPSIKTKFAQMYLSYISSRSLKHKTAGSKLTLVSDFGYNKSNGERLKWNSKGSEIIVSEKFLEFYNITKKDIKEGNVDQELLKEILTGMGVRIPTQDKHSMVSFKILEDEILPGYMGNIVILPAEIIALSGADFDIDSLYVRVFESDKKMVYGNYLKSENPVEDAWKEFVSDSIKRNEAAKFAYEKLDTKTKKDPNSKSLIVEQEVITKNEFKKKYQNQIINNVKAYNNGKIIDIDPITISESNNHSLELEKSLISNEGNYNISRTPSSMDIFKKHLYDFFEKNNINLEIDIFDLFSRNSMLDLREANRIGQDNIGPAALFNIVFQRLNNKSSLLGKFKDKIFFNNNEIRTNDIISSIISAMTDNAKEQIAAKFNISIETLSPLLLDLSIKGNIINSILMLKHPIINKINEAYESNKNRFLKSKNERGRLTNKEIIESVLKSEGVLDSLSKNYEDISQEDLLDAVKENKLKLKIAQNFFVLKEMSEDIRAFSRILGLVKGFKPEWSSNNVVEDLKQIGVKFEKNKFVNIKDGNKSEIDFAEVLNSDKHLNSQTKAAIKLAEDSQFFNIELTKPFKQITERVLENFNSNFLEYKDNEENLIKSLISYLTIKSFKHHRGKKYNPQELHTNLIEPQRVNLLKKYPTNFFLNNIKINKTKIKYSKGVKHFYVVESNSWTTKNSDYNELMTHGFRELRNDKSPETQMFVNNIISYLFMKDSLQFKSGSFITQIEPIILIRPNQTLTGVHKLFLPKYADKNYRYAGSTTMMNKVANNYFDIFGTNEIDLISEFEELYSRYRPNLVNLNYIKETTLINLDNNNPNVEYDSATKYLKIKFDNNTEAVQAIKKTGILPEKNELSLFPRYFKIGKSIIKLSKAVKYTENGKLKYILDLNTNTYKVFNTSTKKLLEQGKIDDNGEVKKIFLNSNYNEALYEPSISIGSSLYSPYAFDPIDIEDFEFNITNEEPTISKKEREELDNEPVQTELKFTDTLQKNIKNIEEPKKGDLSEFKDMFKLLDANREKLESNTKEEKTNPFNDMFNMLENNKKRKQTEEDSKECNN